MSLTKTYGGIGVQTNDEGFLENPGDWDERIAEGIAAEYGVPELTAEHWAVIRCVREAYREKRPIPPLRAVSATSGVSMKQLHQLFPNGAVLAQVARISGVAKPTTCL